MSDLKIGNVVRLKSGGPLMTVSSVTDVYGEPMIFCDWFVQDKAPWKKEHGGFPPASLRLIEA